MEIRKAKIKYDDGSYSESYPIGANSTEVDLPDGKKLNEGYLEINENIYDLKRKNESQDDETEILRGQIRQNRSEIDKLELAVENQERKINNIKKDEIYFIFPKNFTHGGGDCSIIKTKNKVIMIDCYTSNAWANINQMLIDNNITHLDYFILSHYHVDHMGNFVNLVNNNYIDNRTKLYMPAYVDLIPTKCQDLYDTVHDCISNHNFEYEIPVDYSRHELDKNLFFTFYNMDAQWINENILSDYNNASMVCLIEYGDTKALFTGDAGTPIMTKMYDNNFITSQVDLYKIEHHGINQAFDINFMERIHPIYAYDPTNVVDSSQNNFSDCPTTRWLQENDTRIYATHSSMDYIIFRNDSENIFPIQGNQNSGIASIDYEKIIYVDNSVVDGVRNGTQQHPYKDLTQAISEIESNNSSCHYVIKIADGEYNNTHPAAKKNRSHIINVNNITIESLSEDATKVKLITGLYIENSNVILKNLTIYNDNYQSITAYSSIIKVQNCTITNLNGYNGNSGMGITSCDLTVSGSYFYDLNVGISAYYSDLAVLDTSFNTFNAAAIQCQYGCKLVRRNLTFENMNWKNYNLGSGSVDITELVEANPLKGKKIGALGDSLIYGNSIGNEYTSLYKIAERNNMTYTNYGLNGNPIAYKSGITQTPMCQRYSSMSNNLDYIVVLGGANDRRLNIPIGTNEDTQNTTFKGALKILIEGLLTKYPGKKILFMTNYNRVQGKNSVNAEDKDYVDAMLEICGIYGIPCFDNYRKSGISWHTNLQISWADEGVYLGGEINRHLSPEAYDFLIPVYENLLKSI